MSHAVITFLTQCSVAKLFDVILFIQILQRHSFLSEHIVLPTAVAFELRTCNAALCPGVNQLAPFATVAIAIVHFAHLPMIRKQHRLMKVSLQIRLAYRINTTSRAGRYVAIAKRDQCESLFHKRMGLFESTKQ